jgi:glycosyltransferase involved in cell wall biosynthesis
MLWAKGIQEFVEASVIIKNKYKNVEFQLLGHLDVESPTAISKVQMDIWVKNGFVNYLGTSDDVRVEISEADCVVLPSFYREGTPRILLESASMEKPIITTNNVGCKDVVDDGINGFLCNIKDSVDLASKMEKILNLTQSERNFMGKEGRKKMLNFFDEKIVINKYVKAVEEILK